MQEHKLEWSNKTYTPSLGARVNVNFNGLGPGKVIEYAAVLEKKKNWLVCIVELENPPKWYIEQHKDYTQEHGHLRPAWVFGAELSKADAPDN